MGPMDTGPAARPGPAAASAEGGGGHGLGSPAPAWLQGHRVWAAHVRPSAGRKRSAERRPRGAGRTAMVAAAGASGGAGQWPCWGLPARRVSEAASTQTGPMTLRWPRPGLGDPRCHPSSPGRCGPAEGSRPSTVGLPSPASGPRPREARPSPPVCSAPTDRQRDVSVPSNDEDTETQACGRSGTQGPRTELAPLPAQPALWGFVRGPGLLCSPGRCSRPHVSWPRSG